MGQNNKSQANFFSSLYSFRFSILSARSTLLLEPEMKREIRVGYDTDTRWTHILRQSESVQGHRRHERSREHRLYHQFLEVHCSTEQEKEIENCDP